MAGLERQRLLHHAHFSAFQPVVGTPFEGSAADAGARESRLYQAEHLCASTASASKSSLRNRR